MAEKRAADIGSIEPIEQNPVLGATSRGLAALRDKLGYVPLPDVLGGDLGHALLGQSPEEIENWSYGYSPFLDPHYTGVSGFGVQPSRAQGLMDVGFLPVGESLASAKLGTKGLGALARKALEEGAPKTTDAGRRQFLKSVGAAGAAGAVGAKAIPKLFEEEGGRTARKAAAKITAHATPEEFNTAMHLAHEKAYADFNNAIDKFNYANKYLSPEEQVNRAVQNFTNNHGKNVVRDRLNLVTRKIEAVPDASDVLEAHLLENRLAQLRANPKYSPYSDYIYPQGHIDLEHEIMVVPDHPFNKFKYGGTIENTTHNRKIL